MAERVGNVRIEREQQTACGDALGELCECPRAAMQTALRGELVVVATRPLCAEGQRGLRPSEGREGRRRAPGWASERTCMDNGQREVRVELRDDPQNFQPQRPPRMHQPARVVARTGGTSERAAGSDRVAVLVMEKRQQLHSREVGVACRSCHRHPQQRQLLMMLPGSSSEVEVCCCCFSLLRLRLLLPHRWCAGTTPPLSSWSLRRVGRRPAAAAGGDVA